MSKAHSEANVGPASTERQIQTAGSTNLVKQEFGRGYNTTNEAYILPTDSSEWLRLNTQHRAITAALGLYPCADVVEAILAPGRKETQRILDVGCGTGIWALEMAQLYPHVKVRGIDLVPVPLSPSDIPANLSFDISDVNKGMQPYEDQYDVIHMRLIRAGMTNYSNATKAIQCCLTPGGILISIEYGRPPVDDNFNPVILAKVEGDEDVDGVGEDGSWVQRMHWETNQAAKMTGADLDRNLEPDLWTQPLLDPTTCLSGSLYVPVGPWASSESPSEDQALKKASELMRQVLLNLHHALHAALFRHGLRKEMLDDWSRHCDEELTEMKLRYAVRFVVCVGQRRLHEQSSDTPHHSPLAKNYPSAFLKTFHTAAEAEAARKWRRDNSHQLPTSVAERVWRMKQASA